MLALAVLGGGCAAAAEPDQSWARHYEAEFGRYQVAQTCHDHSFDGRALAALRADAARRGYAAAVRRIEREIIGLRSKELIVCATDGGGKGH
jgi:hypothetical protein